MSGSCTQEASEAGVEVHRTRVGACCLLVAVVWSCGATPRAPADGQASGAERYQEVETALVFLEQETIDSRETFELLWPELFVGPDACVTSDVEPRSEMILIEVSESWKTGLMLCQPDELNPLYVGFVIRHHDGWWAWEQEPFAYCEAGWQPLIPSPSYDAKTGVLTATRLDQPAGGCGSIASLRWGRGRWESMTCQSWDFCARPRVQEKWPVTDLHAFYHLWAIFQFAELLSPSSVLSAPSDGGDTLPPAFDDVPLSRDVHGEYYVYETTFTDNLPSELHVVFLEPSDEGIIVASWATRDDASTEPIAIPVLWTELIEGSEFPSATTLVSSSLCETEAEVVSGNRYVLAGEHSVIVVCYSEDSPGLPVRYERWRDGEVVMSLVLSRRTFLSARVLAVLEPLLEHVLVDPDELR